VPRSRLTIGLALALALALCRATAMDVRRVEAQIIMSGAIDGGELARMRDILAEPAARAVDTVVLRDSPGGDYWTSQRIAEMIRERGWRTAVSGYCFSGCALMFLGGRQRHFTDDKPVLQTQIAFHGTYYVVDGVGAQRGDLNPVTTHAARQWMKRHTEGRMSDAMLDRFESLPRSDFIHFFDAGRLPRKDQPSVFVCPRDKETKAHRCKPIAGTDAYREGIVTTSELIRSADRRGE
jgi:hypothetical protein